MPVRTNVSRHRSLRHAPRHSLRREPVRRWMLLRRMPRKTVKRGRSAVARIASSDHAAAVQIVRSLGIVHFHEARCARPIANVRLLVAGTVSMKVQGHAMPVPLPRLLSHAMVVVALRVRGQRSVTQESRPTTPQLYARLRNVLPVSLRWRIAVKIAEKRARDYHSSDVMVTGMIVAFARPSSRAQMIHRSPVHRLHPAAPLASMNPRLRHPLADHSLGVPVQ